MGRCGKCGARIGFLGKRYRKLDGVAYCQPCTPEVMLQRKQQALAEIGSGPDPVVLVRSRAIAKDPDNVRGRRRCTGMLLLTSRGFLFAQYDSYVKADEFMGLALLGWLGLLIGEVADSRKKTEALAALDPLVAIPDSDVASIVENADQVFFYPPETVRKLKTSGRFLWLTPHHRKAIPFNWHADRETIKRFRGCAKAYARAARTGRDPIDACQSHLESALA